ncbi:MAG: hypothetical protein AB3N13_10910, partial [Arenibacterium sp.]
MATRFFNITLDGVTAFPRLDGTLAEWFGGSRSNYSEFYVAPNPGDTLDSTVELTGADWTIRYFRLTGEEGSVLRLFDADNQTGRELRFLELGYNSDVDLTTTRVRYVFGWDGESHSVKLGDQDRQVFSVNLFADENEVVTGSAYVNAIVTEGPGETVTGDTISIGSGGAGSIRTGVAGDKVDTGDGFVRSVATNDGNDK